MENVLMTLLFANTELVIALIGIASSIFSGLITIIVIPLVAYMFKREVRRIDLVEAKGEDIENKYNTKFDTVNKKLDSINSMLTELHTEHKFLLKEHKLNSD